LRVYGTIELTSRLLLLYAAFADILRYDCEDSSRSIARNQRLRGRYHGETPHTADTGYTVDALMSETISPTPTLSPAPSFSPNDSQGTGSRTGTSQQGGTLSPAPSPAPSFSSADSQDTGSKTNPTGSPTVPPQQKIRRIAYSLGENLIFVVVVVGITLFCMFVVLENISKPACCKTTDSDPK